MTSPYERAASLLRKRARRLRTEEGRIEAEWAKWDAEMVAAELDRQAEAIRDLGEQP